MITPNIDQIAGQSVLFDRHYCSVPFSGPSRASMIAEHEAAVARQDSLHDYGETNPNRSTNSFE